MAFILYVITLYFSMTSLITCSQDTCPVVIYKGRIDVNNHVKDHAILGYSYKNLTTDTIHKCFSACVQDCRCVSYQLSGNRCELVDENRHTAPESFKPLSGYVHLELKQEFRNKRSDECFCHNGCCHSSPCQNGGTCMELCDNVTQKFECKCKLGYNRRVCESPIYSCSEYKSKTSSEVYPVLTSNGNSYINLYCDMTSEPGMVWTLIESFALSNKDKYGDKYFSKDFPINENNLNWADYRLSLATMQYVKQRSTHWRATCNYDKDGLVKTDYMRGRLSDVDVVTYRESHGCFLVEYVNIRGKSCSDCTTHLRQDLDTHIFADSYMGVLKNCDINFQKGRVARPTDSCDNFGKYKIVNPTHRCSSSPSSTTQWWLGSD